MYFVWERNDRIPDEESVIPPSIKIRRKVVIQ